MNKDIITNAKNNYVPDIYSMRSNYKNQHKECEKNHLMNS